jgi:hypothetical protein
MKYLRYAFLSVTFLQIAAFAADPGLLKLVMPDAKVLAGMQVAQAKISPFGQYVLGRMQPDDPGFQNFINSTGFDPRTDLTEIVIASNWQGDQKGQWLVLARGSFNPATITAAVQSHGGLVTSFQGVNILAPNGKTAQTSDSVVALLDNSTALMGDMAGVQAAIQRAQGTAPAGFVAPDKVNHLSAQYDFWFLTLVPLSEFSGVVPNQNVGQAMQGNLFQAVLQASGGARFGAQNVMFGAEALTRSDKDASALVDVVKFIAGLLQTNKSQNSTASQVSTLLDTMTVQASGSTMTMALTVPEATMEQLFQGSGTHQQARAHRKHAPAAPVQ